jgi:hypothetical protein
MRLIVMRLIVMRLIVTRLIVKITSVLQFMPLAQKLSLL